MRSLKKIGIGAALAAASFIGSSPVALAQRLDEAAQLNNRLIELSNARRYADAIPVAQRLLAVRQKTLSPGHPDIAGALNNLAMLYYFQHRYADAEPLFQRALRILEKVLGHDHSDVMSLLNNLAGLYERQGRYADAEPVYRRALATQENTLGPDHPNLARPLNNLAHLHYRLARYAEAEPLYRRALAIREKALGRDHPDVATVLSNLALLYKHQGRYADVEASLQRVLAIREKALGRDHPDVAESLDNLAGLYADYGRYADAELLYKRALAIREKVLGRDHPDVATVLHNLSRLYDDQRRYADAAPMGQRALAIWEKAFGPDHPDLAMVLSGLASLYGKQGRHAEAERLLRRALAIQERAFGRDHPNVASSLITLGLLHFSQGQYVDTETLFQRALTIQERALGRDHPNVADTLNDLADLYERQGRYADALPIVRRTMSQLTANGPVALRVLFQSQEHGLVSAAQARTDSYEVAQRASFSGAANAISQLAARFAAGTSELAQLVRRDQDLAAEAEGLDKAVVTFLSKPAGERSAAAEAGIRKRIEEVRAERARLSEIFNQRFPDYVALSRPQPVPLTETQALLAEDEALLVFDFDAKSYAWIITRTDADWTELKISSSDLDEKVQALRAGLTDPRGRFEPALAYEVYQATFGAFGGKIAARKRISIVTNGALTSLPPHLLVTKDPSGKKLKEMDWLVRSHALTILPSVASLKVLRGGSQNSSARRPMIAFADPVFSKSARRLAQHVALRSITSFHRGPQVDIAALGEYLPQLPGSRREVTQIAAELKAPTDDIRLGLAATETAVKQAKLDQYRIVYFATHGLVSGQLEQFAKSKVEPALALSIPDKPNDFDDGLLTASEIAQLKLDADWVVLSACNTAAEDRPGAEALSGLARAFFYANARSLLVSHWSVSDEATARLMIATFRASLRDPKLSHAEALRQAMLAMIDAASSDAHASPLFWAPFVVVGEPAKPR